MRVRTFKSRLSTLLIAGLIGASFVFLMVQPKPVFAFTPPPNLNGNVWDTSTPSPYCVGLDSLTTPTAGTYKVYARLKIVTQGSTQSNVLLRVISSGGTSPSFGLNLDLSSSLMYIQAPVSHTTGNYNDPAIWTFAIGSWHTYEGDYFFGNNSNRFVVDNVRIDHHTSGATTLDNSGTFDIGQTGTSGTNAETYFDYVYMTTPVGSWFYSYNVGNGFPTTTYAGSVCNNGTPKLVTDPSAVTSGQPPNVSATCGYRMVTPNSTSNVASQTVTQLGQNAFALTRNVVFAYQGSTGNNGAFTANETSFIKKIASNVTQIHIALAIYDTANLASFSPANLVASYVWTYGNNTINQKISYVPSFTFPSNINYYVTIQTDSKGVYIYKTIDNCNLKNDPSDGRLTCGCPISNTVATPQTLTVFNADTHKIELYALVLLQAPTTTTVSTTITVGGTATTTVTSTAVTYATNAAATSGVLANWFLLFIILGIPPLVMVAMFLPTKSGMAAMVGLLTGVTVDVGIGVKIGVLDTGFLIGLGLLDVIILFVLLRSGSSG